MSVLETIFAERRKDVLRAQQQTSLADLKVQIQDQPPPRGFLDALRAKSTEMALIAEIKPASPSQGAINVDLDPAQVARDYALAGAHALSVLTEPRHFGGKRENLIAARAACALPALRKDFLDDPYQIYEARAWGADAILLIVAALSVDQIRALSDLAGELGMDVLVEVHTKAEADIALAVRAKLIGVNTRDLATLKTDLAVADRLLPMLGEGVFRIAESAILSREDVDRVKLAGADGVLIGTAFCSAPDIAAKVRDVMGWPCG